VNDPAARPTRLEDVVSRREARLIFWLVLVALFLLIVQLSWGIVAVLAAPAIILFVAWLMAYVLEPPVSFLHRHLPFRGRGIAVAITYVVTAVVAVVVIGAAFVAIVNAAVAFTDNLPGILTKVGDLLRPIVEALGIRLPDEGDVVAAILDWLRQNASQLTDAATAVVRNAIGFAAALVTAVIISVGLAAGQVSLLGWMRRFLPKSTYRDLTELERAIAVSFGGFVRGRLVIGLVYGTVICIAAIVLGIPYGPLIGVIAGLIVFIPWIGPLIGWAVLPAFALVLAPEAVVPAAVVSIVAAVAIQLVVTQLVMGAAVKMSPVAVFVVVMLGGAVAGILGAIFAIPVAAAFLAITDYLRQRDVLLRRTDEGDPDEADEAAAPGQPAEPESPHAPDAPPAVPPPPAAQAAGPETGR
jgi:predicted PurR-regulated permease PerM